METMNIALSESMKRFVQERVTEGGYSSVSEYVRELIRADQKRKGEEHIDALLLDLQKALVESAVRDRDLPDPREALIVPRRVVAAQLHLQAVQSVAPDPVREEDRVAVLRLGAGQLGFVNQVLAADEVPRGQLSRDRRGEEILRIFIRE